MQTAIRFDPERLPPETETLRAEVRAFIAEEIAAGTFDPAAPQAGPRVDKAFSKRVAARGWIGMTWPKRFGGAERSFLDRYVVTEEFLAVKAPTDHHFVADRQSGPVIMKYGRPELQETVLPRIVAGDACFCIGMSEPGSGSDLFAAKTKAEQVPGGWRVNGEKVWTSFAHHADYMIGLFRTAPPTPENRRHGLSQFVVDMNAPGVDVRPIASMLDAAEFNEVRFTDAVLPEHALLGELDGAWRQATSELAYERSGPERFLETFFVLKALLDVLGEAVDDRAAEGVGRLVAQLHTLRRMSVSVAGMLEAGEEPALEASIVKDLGTLWEQALPARARDIGGGAIGSSAAVTRFEDMLDYATLMAPKLTIQGGSTEILRGIIARGLGLR